MSQKHPAEITTAALDALARNMLCRDFHQRQASARSYEWRRRIESYLREQEELLERDLETEQLRALLDESNAGFKEAMAAVRKTEKKIDSLDKRAKASERDLHQQVEASSCEVAVLLEAKASSDEKARLSGMEAESARQKSQASNARYEALEAKMSKDSKRKLEKVNQDLAKRDQHIEQLLEQKEELKHELAERDHDVQQLVEQKEGLKQQLAERDQDVQQLVEQKEGLKQKLVERDQDVQQLMEQKEGMKQKVVERDQDVQQLVEQKKELKQVLAEREVGRL